MVLKAKREKGIALEELVLKKWIGQLLEALHYMHSQETIHRCVCGGCSSGKCVCVEGEVLIDQS